MRLHFGYAALIFALFGWGQHAGWSLTQVNQGKSDPKSVRNNPGGYRPIYAGIPRHIGGK